jgi:hypothetical protein
MYKKLWNSIASVLIVVNLLLAISNLITTSRNNAMLESLVQQQTAD